MIPTPTKDDLSRDPVADLKAAGEERVLVFFAAARLALPAWIRRAAAAELDRDQLLAELRRQAASDKDQEIARLRAANARLLVDLAKKEKVKP